ncbi:unnamed protein product (macronuclear) [Paramecium tetraurelia]|uniref:RRM domain-containing protein n=1 Tax=Paramecium tetraurelia TaxID=5888 RepID=A0DA33_PARTE|nr:uncharacterized protein GSPATT00039350001 [Paramecium tetraurelia]CAK79900.1 unnamed protein product [Paramecium tetraurelia]|eukprot:XP_001447297.1 hypothetical protein (macronuclear) [Paramecium tetraurelia strain d4-2]
MESRSSSEDKKEKKRKRSRSQKKDKKKQKSKKSKERKSKERKKSEKKKSNKKSEKKKKKDKEREKEKDKEKDKEKEKEKDKEKDNNKVDAQKQGEEVETKEQRIARLKQERRKRSRSNSAVKHYQKQILANNPVAKSNALGYDKQDCFWDGFTWVPKTNLHDKVREDKEKVMSLTSRMRRIQICNIPTGLTNRDLYAELSRFMNRNYLNDVGNAKPILYCHLNEKDRTCTLELSSVEESNRMLKLEEIKLLDESCKIFRLGDSLYGQSVNQSQLVQQAHNMAQAQAAAYLALKSLGYARGQREEDEILAQAGIPSRIIKVGNFLNVAMAINLNKNEWNEMREDLLEGFSQYGHIEDDFFVKPFQAGLGAEAGSLFLVYTTIEDAQRTVISMTGITYNQRALKIIFINEQTYIRSYIPLKLKQQPEIEEPQINQENDNYDNEPFEDQEDYLDQMDNKVLENNNNKDN